MALDAPFAAIHKAFEGPLAHVPLPSPLPLKQKSSLEKNTLLDRALADVADRETKLAETWAQCEAKLKEKQAKYKETVAAQQAAFDASLHRMSEELNRAVAQQEDTTEGLAAERAAHEHTRLALAATTKRATEQETKVTALKAELNEANAKVEAMKKREAAEAEQLTKLQTETLVVKLTKDHLSGKLDEANAKLAAARAELESTASRLATSSVMVERLQREKEETEAKLRQAQLSNDAASALAAQRADEVAQLTRERDNLVSKNTTLRDNATEDAQRLAQLHERIAALEARSPDPTKKAAPRHPIAVANSAAKGRSRRSLSAGPSPATLDLTADSGEEDDENNQPSTRKHRSGKRTGAAGTPKK